MARQTTTPRHLQNLPKKWALTVVAALILYASFQPLANSRLGWHWPSLVNFSGNESPASSREADLETPAQPFENLDTNGSSAFDASPRKVEEAHSDTFVQPNLEITHRDPSLKFGLLKDVGRETYLSPAGLRYTSGSEEGHRLKHLERHLKDIPDRPGKHGVFEGGMEQVLQWIDHAYLQGQRRAQGATKRSEEGRTIYEVPFSHSIGYVGGREGQRARHPDAKWLRLVVEGDKFITSFPY